MEGDFRAVMDTARGLRRRVVLLIAMAVSALLLSILLHAGPLRLTVATAGLTLLVLAGAILLLSRFSRLLQNRQNLKLAQLMGEDLAACFATDELGQILYCNGAAEIRFGTDPAGPLDRVLNEVFAAPAAVLYRLKARAENLGAAREDVVTRRGYLRLSVHRFAARRFLWRMEEFNERPAAGRGAEGLSLPMIVVNKAGVVLFSNEAMRRLIGERPKLLDKIIRSQRLENGDLVEVCGAKGVLQAIFAEIDGSGERREIFLLPATRHDEAGVPTDFENVPVALMKFSIDGRLRSANRAAREMLGKENIEETLFHEFFEDIGRPACDWLADVIEGRIPNGVEVLRLKFGEEERFAQVQLSRIVENGWAGALAILSDATALKRMETQFNQSQKMQAVGQLAGGIAHDFNNLLTAISGHCDLLLLRHSPEDSEFGDLEQIRQNANRAAGLVSQLLAFSRKQTLKPERLDLQEVLGEVTHLLNRLLGEKVSLRLAHDPLLGPVRADRRRLEQVLMNLVVNARDAMPLGGIIRIETEAFLLNEPLQRGQALIPAGEYSVIRVRDTGIGIAPDRLDKVFEPFFTTKKIGEGTGLGLSTVYGIVKQSGGYVFVESELGEGTSFEVFLPVHELLEPSPPAPAPPEPARSAFQRDGNGVVLLVEDEAPVRAFASRALRMRGYVVIEAENAEGALKLLEDPALKVDVFVTDVVMPGIDGPSWVREALKERPDVRVIFVSGYTEDALSEDQSRIPNSVFLPKPFSLTELAATVQGQLH